MLIVLNTWRRFPPSFLLFLPLCTWIRIQAPIECGSNADPDRNHWLQAFNREFYLYYLLFIYKRKLFSTIQKIIIHFLVQTIISILFFLF
jgi:hypothetical protein